MGPLAHAMGHTIHISKYVPPPGGLTPLAQVYTTSLHILWGNLLQLYLVRNIISFRPSKAMFDLAWQKL